MGAREFPQWGHTHVSMTKPRALKPGDTIALVSPSSNLTPEKTQRMIGILEAEGYQVKPMPNVYAAAGYLAGSDAERASDLQAAFDDPDVDAVLCSRGGYGCARLFPLLDLDRIAATGKMFMGFSDITTLHLALNRRGLVTIHSPMAITLSVDREPWVYESFVNTLKGGNPIPETAPKGECVVPGTAEGVVVGGCMCLLTDSIGTADALDCDGKILVIEDVDENPHRVDAMLTHLLNSGIVQKAAGIAIGEMTRTDERADPTIGAMPWKEIVHDRLASLGIPLMTGLPFGHMANMLTLPLGVRARLDASAGALTYLEGHTS